MFVRGSGEEQNYSQSYLEFKRAFEDKMQYLPSISYDFVDLNYPAISVADDLSVPIKAFFSGGESYEFGNSVNAGVLELENMVNGTCPNTKFVLAGYSQGAMVITKTLPTLNADKIIYAATFGDPKLYLPEGENFYHPAACYDGTLSEYRRYVPDCHTFEGILGSYRPYRPENFTGKVGVWCNNKDIVCNRSIFGSIGDHLDYVSDGLYEDASRYVFNKITEHFGVENNYVSPHDTAILIDSTGSMWSMVETYKTEALRLANETFAAGGRVALYDYRDLQELYEPRKHCDFTTCTPEVFAAELDSIVFENGGDEPESFLSAAFHMMSELTWQEGATKSVVAITDAGYHMPDIDHVQIDDVVALSRRIDPVNFYIVTDPRFVEDYQKIAEPTDGAVAVDVNSLHVINDTIMERFDSLPALEEHETITDPELPILDFVDVAQIDENAFHVSTGYTGKLIVFLNETCLGLINASAFDITDIDFSKQNILRIVPFDGTARGDAIEVELVDTFKHDHSEPEQHTEIATPTKTPEEVVQETLLYLVPKVPNTGRK
ncbi:cutinase family protein [Candidatus Saccharibacteria bacterium]|nr:cutinase family protein [Candidatus Saccharibacteria bacterium]